MTRVMTRWNSLLGASIGFSALLATSGLAQQLPLVPKADPAPAVEPAKEAAEDAKDAVKDATDTAKDAVKDTKEAVEPLPGAVRDAAREAREGGRDTAREAREGARDAARDARDTVQDAREGARDTARDARDTVRDAREGVRDTVRDARDAARDTVREVRDTVRDARVSGSARANLRWQDMQPADLGLWFDRRTTDGLVIADVSTQGPIAELGFQEGDRIVSVNGRVITRQADFMPFLFSANVAGGRVPVVVLRGGRQISIDLDPQVFITYANSSQSDPLEQIGIVVDDRVQDKALIWRVVPRSAAFYAGLRSGDIVTSFNSKPVSTSAELSLLASKAEPGTIALEVQRGDKARQLEVDFQMPNTEVRSALRPDYDSAAPALNTTAPARGYYNSYAPRRGLFRWRR
jgi:C-terminal processing protease CtpA/Prc